MRARSPRPARAAWLAAVLALTFSAAGARAADDPRQQSRAAFRRGVEQVGVGNFQAARDSFLEAYKLVPHPSILLNLGIARTRIGEYVEAEQDLVRFLSDDGGATAEEIALARSTLADVRPHLSTFRIRVVPSGARATLDARPIALSDAFVDVRSTVGAHILRVDREGYEPVERTVTLETPQSPDVDVVLRSSSILPTGASGRPVLGWALVGTGVASAGFGAFAALRARALADDYNTPNSGSFQDASTRSSGVTFRTLADVSFIVALAAGGAGVYFLLTSPSAPANGSAQTRLVVGPGSALLVRSF